MLIHRHRFSNFVAERAYNGSMEEEPGDIERDAMTAAHACAIQVISSYMQVAAKGLMTYYGVHVIHQLTQAGRTLLAILINCKSEKLQPLIQPALETLRSCVGLLRRFSGRYVCGQRSGDLMEEFCRLTQIPLEPSHSDSEEQANTRPPWIRPVRKKTPNMAKGTGSDGSSHHSSPEAFSPSEFFVDPGVGITSAQPFTAGHYLGRRSSLTLPSFLDTAAATMEVDPSIYMSSPAEVMSMLGDGSVDVSTIFTPDFNAMGSHSTESRESSLYRHLGNSGSLVTTP